MALRELVEGDCGGPSPFSMLTSHFVQDRGYREDGIGRERNVNHHVAPLFENTTADQLVEEYIESNTNVHPQTFRMKDIMHDLNEIASNTQQQCTAKIHEPLDQDSEWANQFLGDRTEFYEQNTDNIWAENQQQPQNILPSMPVQDANELGLGETWAEDYIEHSLESGNNEINKPLDELKNTDIESPNIAFSKFLKFMHQEGEIVSESVRNQAVPPLISGPKWVQDYSEHNNLNTLQEQCPVDSILKNENTIKDKNDQSSVAAGVWANEFLSGSPNNVDADTYESNFWARLQGEWDKLSNNHLTDTHPWISDYESYYDPYKDYKFNNNNPMKDVTDALEEGKRRLNAGDLPSAVLCFEAAVQQDEENPEAWLLLGKTQAENEQDPLAIAALKKCLTLETSNATALMTLAVSYTNESFQNQACLTLKEWLLKNKKYNHLLTTKSSREMTGTRKSSVSTILFKDVHNEVKELFIQAARMNPENKIDADVQSGLGVLFNLSSEFDKAADCFRSALQVRPDDCRLWNRLGASLANGQRSEEAVEAYSHALELSPGFIRARYNLGISCIKLGAYKEAGEHLLTALNQQAAGRDAQGQSAPRAMSETIWSTFRLVLSLMHKFHLNEAVENRDLAKLNAEFEIA